MRSFEPKASASYQRDGSAPTKMMAWKGNLFSRKADLWCKVSRTSPWVLSEGTHLRHRPWPNPCVWCWQLFLVSLLFSKDVKNAYFSGHEIGRELYLQQPRGGLPGLKKGQLLRARKAIYGVSESTCCLTIGLGLDWNPPYFICGMPKAD